jgi:Holliday junction resolvasome RuvABC ATP-dependent DNA helicase subunit
MTTGPLAEPVTRFIDQVSETFDILAASVGRPAGALVSDVAAEAWHIAAALVDADGSHTRDELEAMASAFGDRLDTPLTGLSPADIRQRAVLDGTHTWIATPSPLFSLLVDADRKYGSMNSWRYYDAAMDIAHTACAIDTVTTQGELQALDQLRTTLLKAMEEGGLRNPWTGRSPLSGRPVEASVAARVGPDAESPTPVATAPATPPRPIEELLSELNAMIGLKEVKTQVRLVTNLIRVQQLRRQHGLPVTEASHHLVFTGNPGTGKTTVARLVAQIYRTLGVVDKGQLVETGRADLVAGYMGQTAAKTTAVFDTASGGVLLIDEAYALNQGTEDTFGREAVNTLVKLIEDRRDEVVVVVAGYTAEMDQFLDANPGLRSRFPRTIHFPDYSTSELVEIFDSLCKGSSYRLTPGAHALVTAVFDTEPRTKGFGNGRMVRNLFEAALERQAGRLADLAEPTEDDLCQLTDADIDEATLPLSLPPPA